MLNGMAIDLVIEDGVNGFCLVEICEAHGYATLHWPSLMVFVFFIKAMFLNEGFCFTFGMV